MPFFQTMVGAGSPPYVAVIDVVVPTQIVAPVGVSQDLRRRLHVEESRRGIDDVHVCQDGVRHLAVVVSLVNERARVDGVGRARLRSERRFRPSSTDRLYGGVPPTITTENTMPWPVHLVTGPSGWTSTVIWAARGAAAPIASMRPSTSPWRVEREANLEPEAKRLEHEGIPAPKLGCSYGERRDAACFRATRGEFLIPSPTSALLLRASPNPAERLQRTRKMDSGAAYRTDEETIEKIRSLSCETSAVRRGKADCAGGSGLR